MTVFFSFVLRILKRLVITFIFSSIFLVIALKWVDPPVSMYMVQSSVSNWFKKSPAILQNEWVDYDDISKQMVLAVITSEDQLFPDHWGFDLKQISETIEDFQKGNGLRGASTITQQLAKNLFLWNGRSFIRKGFEAYFTILLELFHSKRRIMELYLNIIELGPMVFGVKSASKTYFKKEPKNLTRYQSALIASVLPNPIRFKIDKPSDYLRNRQLEIAYGMRVLGGLNYIKGI